MDWKAYQNELLENKKEDDKYYSNLSLTYIKTNDYETALKYAIIALKLNNKSAKYWGRLGSILHYMNRKNEALKAYEKTMELDSIYGLKFVDNMEQIKNKKINMDNLVDNVMNTILEDKDIMSNLSNPYFINKIESYQINPLQALNDPMIMNMLKTVMRKIV